MIEVPSDQIWMIVVGFLIAFLLAFGIGANDVANSFGTSVGSGVLTLRQACILASIFETLGAILLGSKVSDTIRKGIIETNPYVNNTEELMLGNVAALSGSCIWLFIATLLRLPVSATHSIVGATVGFALVAHGFNGINIRKLCMIVGSWFISPLLAGLLSTLLFYLCNKLILSKEEPLKPGLAALPIFYALIIIVNTFSVFYDGPEMFGFDHIPLWGTFIISFGSGIITIIVVYLIVVPWQRRRIESQMEAVKSGYTSSLKQTDSLNKNKYKFSNGAANTQPCNTTDDEKKDIIEMRESKEFQLEGATNMKMCTKKDTGASNIIAMQNTTNIMVPNKTILKKEKSTD